MRKKFYWCGQCKLTWLDVELPAGYVGDLTEDQLRAMDIGALRVRTSKEGKTETVAQIEEYISVHEELQHSPEHVAKLRSLLEASTATCPRCSSTMGTGFRREVLNVPRLLFLAVLTSVGILGIQLRNETLQLLGFGIPILYAFVGIAVINNLRWIFVRWTMETEPPWYATRRWAAFRSSLAYAFVVENAVALGVLVLVGMLFLFAAIGRKFGRVATDVLP